MPLPFRRGYAVQRVVVDAEGSVRRARGLGFGPIKTLLRAKRVKPEDVFYKKDAYWYAGPKIDEGIRIVGNSCRTPEELPPNQLKRDYESESRDNG